MPVTVTNARIAFDRRDYLGETPVWSVDDQLLYYINCEDPPRLRGWNPETEEMCDWPMPERIGGFALRRSGNPIVCLASGVYDLNLTTGALTLIASSPYAPEVKLHESAVDRKGRLWIGGFDQSFGPDRMFPGGAAFARLDGGILTTVIPHLSITNMLAFSPAGDIMYFSDSLRRVIWAANMDPDSGALLGMREFIRLPDEVSGDGAAIDVEGGYWLAVFGAGEVRRYLPDGTLDHVEKLPFSQPTKPCFGGSDLKTIYVTSTQMAVPGFPQSGPNGAVYQFDVSVKGIAEEYFAG